MKIAVCMFGITGGFTGPGGEGKQLDPILSFKNYSETIFKDYDIDFFIHSWSLDFKESLIEIYKPKNYLFEEQKDFSFAKISNHSLDHINTYRKLFSDHKDVRGYLQKYIFNAYSKWYSTCKSIKLMQDFSETNKVSYDLVLQLRFDLFFREKIKFEEIDQKKFYCPPRFEIDKDLTINDTWMLSSYENAVKFSSIYDNLENYSIWTHASSRQHLERLGIEFCEYPNPSMGKKNYWHMRIVLQNIEKNKENKKFLKRINRSLLFRVRSFFQILGTLIKKVESKINSYLNY